MSEVVKRPAKGIYVPPGRKRLEQQNSSSEEKPASPSQNASKCVPKTQINSKITNSNLSSESSSQISDNTESSLETKELVKIEKTENPKAEMQQIESKYLETLEMPTSPPNLEKEETTNVKSETLEKEHPEKVNETKPSPTSENKEEMNNIEAAKNENSKIKVDIEPEITQKSEINTNNSESETESNPGTTLSPSQISNVPEIKEKTKSVANNNEVQTNSNPSSSPISPANNNIEVKSEATTNNNNNNNEVQTNSNPSSPPTSPSRKKPDIQLFVPRRRLEAMEEEKAKKEKMKELELAREKKRIEDEKAQEEHQKRIEEAFFPERALGKSPARGKDNEKTLSRDTASREASPPRAQTKGDNVNWNDLIDETPMGYYGAKSKPVTSSSPKREERKISNLDIHENKTTTTTTSPSHSNKKMSWRNHDDSDGGNYESATTPFECIESYAHLVEAYDLANGMQVADIEDIFYGYAIKIKMVNKTNAILVFASERDAADVLTTSTIAKSISIRPFSQSSNESREIWLNNTAMFAMPKNSRKSTTAIVASRMINNSLQLPRTPTIQPREILKRDAK